MGLGTQGNAQYFDVVLSANIDPTAQTNLFLDGSSLLFATQPNKMYSVNVKAQGFLLGDVIGQDLFAIFTTDGSNVVTREHRQRYANHQSGVFALADIDVVAGTGTIDVVVASTLASSNPSNWMAYMWGVEMIQP
jgi:hypothetical protein